MVGGCDAAKQLLPGCLHGLLLSLNGCILGCDPVSLRLQACTCSGLQALCTEADTLHISVTLLATLPWQMPGKCRDPDCVVHRTMLVMS